MATAISTEKWPRRSKWAQDSAWHREPVPELVHLRTGRAWRRSGSRRSRTPDGRRQFEWIDGVLYQRSMVDPQLEWKVNLVKDTVTPGNPNYNIKAARAKLMSRNTGTLRSGQPGAAGNLAHGDDKMECYTCHTSWTPSCGGCHLPIEANWKTARHLYEGGETRNYAASQSPGGARRHVPDWASRDRSPRQDRPLPLELGARPILDECKSRESMCSSHRVGERLHPQAFNPHYPHTERKVETKSCTDCHLSEKNDNNAIMAQLLMYGTNFVNFVGYNAYVGGQGEINAVTVTEWDKPQAVIGSYLHRYAYPDWYQEHQKRGQELQHASRRASAGDAECLQLRGEYLYVAEGARRDAGIRCREHRQQGRVAAAHHRAVQSFGTGHADRLGRRDAVSHSRPISRSIRRATRARRCAVQIRK